MKTHQHTLTGFGAVTALLIAGVIAFANIPAADGLISGCYSTNGGRLRVIDAAAEKCLASERPLAWNARGLQGLKGGPGTNGTNGLNGISVTSFSLPVGDPHCPNGGSQFTSASSNTYACNGVDGGAGGTGGRNERVDYDGAGQLDAVRAVDDAVAMLGTYGNIFEELTDAASFDVVMAMGFPETNLGHLRRISIAAFPEQAGCRYLGTSDPAGQ